MKKVLLDENRPRPLAKLLTAEDVTVISVHDMGWAEKKNGDLIRSMVQEGFEYLLTADKNLQNQQNLENYPIKLIVLRIFDNRFKTLTPFVDFLRQRIQQADSTIRILEIDLRNLEAK